MRIEDESALDKILSGFGAQKFFWRIYAHQLLTRAMGVKRLDVKAQKIFNTKNRRGICGAHLPLQHTCGVKQLELPMWDAMCKFDLFYKLGLYY